mmetsp:Transcript_25724/g.43336  ORF Transcript_25724/g.43336 Transcript_25724/m.43336 type:complete len:214 (-) Transcript_25724:234-875(-)
MDKFATLEFTDLTDVLVPVYSVVMVVFIIVYRMSPETKIEDRYFLKKVPKNIVKKDWRELLTGYFHQFGSDGFDEWLKFLDKPYPVRLIAPKMFHKIHVDLKLDQTHFSIQRFWSPDKVDGDALIKLKLGTSREDAEPIHTPSEKPEDSGTWRAWVVEGEEKIRCEMIPDTPDTHATLNFCREMVDADTLQVTWHGKFKGKECSMTSMCTRIS